MNKLYRNTKLWLNYWRNRHSIEQDIVIVRFDGGICSQIAFWALAHHLSNQNLEVKYDLTWFDENGKDMDGKHVRNFDLPKAFPDCKFRIASAAETYYYRKHFSFNEESTNHVSAPAYLGGYYDRWPLVLQYRRVIQEVFQPDAGELSEGGRNTATLISKAASSCAVHIRRGDLSVYNPVYGEPIRAEYFIKAIQRIEQLFPSTSFFLFSDEPDWARDNVAAKLPKDITYKLMDSYGADKGYLDLFLMCQCKHFIASQGSLAKYAMAISGREDSVIIEPTTSASFKNEHGVHAITL